jgi:hypothetical protein
MIMILNSTITITTIITAIITAIQQKKLRLTYEPNTNISFNVFNNLTKIQITVSESFAPQKIRISNTKQSPIAVYQFLRKKNRYPQISNTTTFKKTNQDRRMKKSPDLSGKLRYKNKRDPPSQPARMRKKAKIQVLPISSRS